MAIVDNNDLFIANRDGKTYKVTGADLYESFGGSGPGPGPGPAPGPSPITPVPGQDSTSPAYAGGDGTESTPYVLTATNAFLNSTVYSEQKITLFGFTADDIVVFEDENKSANGTRFSQPLGTIGSNGQYTFRMQFQDIPITPEPPVTYTAKIKCGDIYWTWAITMEESGISTPTINSIVATDNSIYDAPTAPLYQTDSGPCVSISYPSGTTFTADTSSGELTSITQTGTGSGLKTQWFINSGGDPSFIDIVDGGSGYNWGDTVAVDLSSVGAGTVTLTVFTQPCTSSSGVFGVTAYEPINTGGFSTSEWQFDTDPEFSDPHTTVVHSEAASLAVNTGQPANTQYYARFRYLNVDGVTSSWSNVVRSATVSLMTMKWIFKDLVLQMNASTDTTTYPSFNSGDVPFVPQKGLYIVSVFNSPTAYVDSTPWSRSCTNGVNRCAPGVGGPNGGGSRSYADMEKGCGNGRFGGASFGAIYLQLRQKFELIINSVDGSGGITAASNNNIAYGMNDYIIAMGNTVACTTETGSGAGAQITVKRDPDTGRTLLDAVVNAGSGYAVNDIISVTGFIGNGSNQEGDASCTTGGVTVGVSDVNVGTLDSAFDVLVHGIGGIGGFGGGPVYPYETESCGYAQRGSYNNPCAGPMAMPSWSQPSPGGNPGEQYNDQGNYAAAGTGGAAGVSYASMLYGSQGAQAGEGATGQNWYHCSNAGGGGGGGWGGGGTGGDGQVTDSASYGCSILGSGGSGGPGGSYVNPAFIAEDKVPDCGVATNFGTGGQLELYLNGIVLEQNAVNTFKNYPVLS